MNSIKMAQPTEDTMFLKWLTVVLSTVGSVTTVLWRLIDKTFKHLSEQRRDKILEIVREENRRTEEKLTELDRKIDQILINQALRSTGKHI